MDSMSNESIPEHQALQNERGELLERLAGWLEIPMLVLAFAWLVLLVWELTWGLSPLLEATYTVIWIVFVLHFLVEFTLAPHKLHYLKHNWLTTISLVMPALRAFRVVRLLRALRTARAFRLVKVLGSLNRGMRALGASLGRRGFGYVVGLTCLVLVVGAAGMYAFENRVEGGLQTYGDAVWWTAMIMTTMGSDYWPQTPEGRILCILLALYAFAIFGYVTAMLASFFLERDAESQESDVASARSIAELKTDIAALRAEIRATSGEN